MNVTLNKFFAFFLLAIAVKVAHSASALPTGEKVIHGGVSITRGSTSLFINSDTNRNVISWNDFSVAKGNSVVFSGDEATFLNIVKGSNISVIDGNVAAMGNSSFYLINPNGITVGLTGSVDAKNVILSTSKLTQENADNFIETGDFEFSKKGMGKVKLIGKLAAENTIIDGSQVIIRDLSNIKLETGFFDGENQSDGSFSIHSSIKRIDVGSSKKIDLEKAIGLTKEDGLYDHTDKTAISTREEFLNIQKDPAGSYFITNDIDLGSLTSAVTGTSEFSGKIDGAFNTITYKIEGKGSNLEKNVGLFSTLSNSTIENLKIKNPSISVSSPEDSTYIGALAGVIKSSTLKNIEVDGLNLTFSNLGNNKIYAGGLAGLATYDGVSSSFENVTAGFSTKTQTHLFSRNNYVFGSVLGELNDELNLNGANFGKTDFSDGYDLGVINAVGHNQVSAKIDNEYQNNSEDFIFADGYYQNTRFFIPYFIDSDKIFVTDCFDKIYSYDELIGNNKYFNSNDYIDLNYKYSFGMQKEGNYSHIYSSKKGGQTFYFIKDGKKSETATHTISIEGRTEKPELDDSYDSGFIADEEPDPDMGTIDESDLTFDSDFDCNLLPDPDFEPAPENDLDFDSDFTNDNNPDEDYISAPEEENEFDSEFSNEDLPDEEFSQDSEDENDFDESFTNDELPDEEMGNSPEDDKDFDNSFTNDELPDEEMGNGPEDDKDFDNSFTNDELPDEEMGNGPEDDKDFDNSFTNDELPDEEMGNGPEDDKDFDSSFSVKEDPKTETPSSKDEGYEKQSEKKLNEFSDIIENKRVVFSPLQRHTTLSFQSNYSVVKDIISKSLLASLNLLEDKNTLLADKTDIDEKEDELS